MEKYAILIGIIYAMLLIINIFINIRGTRRDK